MLALLKVKEAKSCVGKESVSKGICTPAPSVFKQLEAAAEQEKS